MANLNSTDIKELKSELTRLAKQLDDEKTTADALIRNQKEVLKLEKTYRKGYNKLHGIITNYERAVNFLTGEHIASPVTELDLQEHAREAGRLWQPTVSLNPKIIAEFVGGGIAKAKPGRYEEKDIGALLGLIEIMREGGNGGATYSSGNLFRNYSSGSNWFLTQDGDNLQPDAWYMIYNRTFLKTGTVTSIPERAGFCDGARGSDPDGGGFFLCPTNRWVEPLSAHVKIVIKSRLDVSGLDSSESMNAVVSTWLGFNNTERINKIATSVGQSVMNAMLSGISIFVARIKSSIESQIIAFDDNEDLDKDLSTRQAAVDFISVLEAYLINKDIHDGPIDTFIALLQNRITYIATMYANIHEAKKVYYPGRINYANLRCNRQSGTISRALYLENPLLSRYPKGGDPGLVTRIKKIKRLLEEV